jgi:protein-tyrosine phosphatase
MRHEVGVGSAPSPHTKVVGRTIGDGDHTKVAVAVDPLHRRISGTTVHGDLVFDAPYMSEVADNLWQGGCAEGLVLPPFIDHLLSLYPWEAYEVTHDLTSFREVRMYDDVNQALEETVPELATWVNQCRQTGPTLVHCQAGLNRSGVVVAFALMLDGMSADEAIARVRERRSPAALCNPQFERWLRAGRRHWNMENRQRDTLLSSPERRLGMDTSIANGLASHDI